MKAVFVLSMLAVPAAAADTPAAWIGEWDVEHAQCNGQDVDGSPFPNYLSLTEDQLSLRNTPCEILKVTPGGLQGVYLFRLTCPDDPAEDALIFMEGPDAMSFAFGLFPQRPLVRCLERETQPSTGANE